MANDKGPSAKVVVGIDGSDHSRAALEWAVVEAARRRNPLRIVHALGMPLIVSAYSGPIRFEPTEEISEQSTGVLSDAEKRARALQPSVEIETVSAVEEAPLALVRQVHPYDLLVVGTRGLGTFASAFVGSVSVRVSAQAPCPVVVVPADDENEPVSTALDRIVVGVDGSPSSQRALGQAASLAEESGAEIVVVHSWEVPFPYDPMAMTAAGYQPQDNVFDQQSEQLVSQAIADLMDERNGAGFEVSVVRSQSNPVEALLDAAEGADAIVVGSRGRGTVRGLLLGSISQGLLHRSRIPVVVLPKNAEEA